MTDREQMLLDHMRDVRYVEQKIRRTLPQHVELEELISAGVVGLVDALSKFDESKECKFGTYTQLRIRGAILDYLRSTDWAPRGLRKQGRAIDEAILEATHRLEREPSEEEVAEQMGVPLAEYQTLITDLRELEVVSLNQERNEESGREEIDYLEGPVANDPHIRAVESERYRILKDAINALPKQERAVVRMATYSDMTHAAIGERLGLCASRISQLHSSAVEKLRPMLIDIGPQSRARTAMSELEAGTIEASTINRSFEARTCICGCGESFIPNGPRQIFVMGHRMPATPAKRSRPSGVVKQPETAFTAAPPKIVEQKVETQVAVSQAPRMVTLNLPESAIENLLRLLPMDMKVRAVEGILADL